MFEPNIAVITSNFPFARFLIASFLNPHFLLKQSLTEKSFLQRMITVSISLFYRALLLSNQVHVKKQGLSDPYCIIRHRYANLQAEHKTTVKKETLTPTWNEAFTFVIKQ